MKEDLLHDLAVQRAETEWPVVPQFFLFSVFGDGCYVSPVPVSGNATGLPLLLKHHRKADKFLLCTDQRKRIFDHTRLDGGKISPSLPNFPKQIGAKLTTKTQQL